MRTLLFLALLLTIGSVCEAQFVPTREPARVEIGLAVLYVETFTPPPDYARWYAWAEQCLQLKGEYSKIHWLITDKPWGMNPDSLTYGMWQKEGRRITINKLEKMDSALIIHESIHDILGAHPEFPDSAVHPKSVYGGQCSWQLHGDIHRPVVGKLGS